MTRVVAAVFAVGGLLAFSAPVNAQSRGNHGGNANHGDGHHGDWHHGHWHNGGNVNFYFGGFGYPFFWGYPYWGYPSYGYPPAYGYGYGYGYGYPVGSSYTYDPRGVYEGRIANRPNGGSGSVATQVQQQLTAGGYYHGEIDGIIGQETRRAIRNYERANNLPVDGLIDDQLLATMGHG